MAKLTFFGHEPTSDSVGPSEKKAAAIRDAQSPKDTSEVRSVMGLVQYLAKFMPDVASTAKPIQQLTRKGITFKWGKEQQTAFQELKFLGLAVGQESLQMRLPRTRKDMEGCHLEA